MPRTPGVYLFLGRHAEVIYVGKAVNLRRRVAQYFQPRQQHAGVALLANIRDLEWRPTPTELHALILEDTLIKEYWPAYNRRQKKYRTHRYLELTDSPFPTLQSVRAGPPLAGRERFGPFANEHVTRELLAITLGCFGLRACADPQPHRRCPRHGIADCSGPCRGEVSQGMYARQLTRAKRFLLGSNRAPLIKLRARMRRFSVAMEYERAAAIRDRLAFCESFLKRQRFFVEFRNERLLFRERATEPRAYLFDQGRLQAYWRHLPTEGELADAEARLADASWEAEPDYAVFDRAGVVRTWLNTRRSKKQVARV